MKKHESGKFNDYFNELQTINHEFEKGELDLEVAVQKFERGLELASILKNRLAMIENKIKEIKIKFTEPSPTEAPKKIGNDEMFPE